MRRLTICLVATVGGSLLAQPASAWEPHRTESSCSVANGVERHTKSYISLSGVRGDVNLYATAPEAPPAGSKVITRLEQDGTLLPELRWERDPLSSRRPTYVTGRLSAASERALRSIAVPTIMVTWTGKSRGSTRVMLNDLAAGFAAFDACQPIAALPGRAATPVGSLMRWKNVMHYDYEETLIATGHFERFEADLSITATGRVSNCAVAASTGAATVDADLCRKITQRMQFVTATDSNGRPIAARYRLALPGVRVQR